jgi:hypothetical protein
MPIVNDEEISAAFNSVPSVPNHPRTFFRYGFKVVEISGEKWIEALSEKEYRDSVEKEGGEALQGRRYCGYTISGCQGFGGCTKCEPHNDGSGWYCTCLG